MNRSRKLRMAAISMAAAACVAAAGCGGENDSQFADRPAPSRTDFPSAQGRTLEQIAGEAVPTQSLVVSPTGRVFHTGRNRFGFGVFTAAGDQVPDASVALYAAPHGGGRVEGPFPARFADLQTAPAFRSRTVALDPQTAKGLYVTEVRFAKEGNWDVVALIRQGDSLTSSRVPTVSVGGFERIPKVGEHVPRIDTPTVESVGGDVSEIDTRSPPSDMHANLADVLGKKPVVLLFATPALCQSRVCGPVVDEELEAKAEFGDQTAFIHMEVYKNNNASDGLRPQMKAFGLPTEPWLFVIDRHGVVSTRIEGAFSPAELDAAIVKAVR